MRAAAARQPFPNEQERKALEQIDAEIAHVTAIPPPPQVIAPGFGEPQRDAIAALIDDHVRGVVESIAALKKQLNALEQQVLVSSAAAKDTLNQQVNVCATVNTEVERIAEIIDEIAQKVLRL